MPLVKRKQILSCLVPTPPATLLYVDHFAERGLDLFRAVCDSDLEGIVAKRKDGLTSWVKIKNPRYSHVESRHELFERRAAGV